MDVYSGYNQIPMYLADEEHASFIIDRGLYCYKMVPLGLKNVEATYRRLVNEMLANFIGMMVKVYMDDMLVEFKRK